MFGKEKSEGLGWASEDWIEKKAAAKAERELQLANQWTIAKLWGEYQQQLPGEIAGKTDLSRWRLYLQTQLSKKEPCELVKLDIDRLRISLLKKRSPQTDKHVLALLRRIINFGVDRALIPLPFKISMPSVDNIKTEDLTPKQLQRLFIVLIT